MNLGDLLARTAAASPDAVALRAPDGEFTYQQLDRLSNQVAHALTQLGVRKGDRIGVWLKKSGKAVAAMQAALRLGAAYVPLDPMSPPMRVSGILRDCPMAALVAEREWAAEALQEDLSATRTLTISAPLRGLSWADVEAQRTEPPPALPSLPGDIAYILFTSGSTGKPKGVCITHNNALAFINWAVEVVKPAPHDRFSSHAPFHFDLSVLDLYAAFASGASVSILEEGASYLPARLIDFVEREKITVWYSVPTALILMMREEKRLPTLSSLRVVLFAGEPFPIKHLRELRALWPDKRFLNLYGPTETNVCTYHEVATIEPDRMQPVPIGRACCGDEVWAAKEDGSRAAVGEEGELLVTGPTVMHGYWGQAPQGDAPYRTGDVVRVLEAGEYHYVGRRDHMVKVRGFRIELGEIEAALLAHPSIRDGAAAVEGEGVEARIVGYLVAASGHPPSLVAIKQHCADRIPRYMIPDQVRWVAELPRTRNGKIDRRRLREACDSNRRED